MSLPERDAAASGLNRLSTAQNPQGAASRVRCLCRALHTADQHADERLCVDEKLAAAVRLKAREQGAKRGRILARL